jgi:periplasmic divalent cation tolerance protein
VEPIVDVTITAPDAEWLAAFTRRLVADRLASSGNISDGVQSIYRWQGQIEDVTEARVVLHTRVSLVSRIIDRTNAEHPYEVPQVLVFPVADANPNYHRWVLDSTIDIDH